jgi:phosphoribosyl-ATP pyrophosphohydrolase
MLSTLENLIKLARERKASPIDGSYTNKLLTDKALSKAKVLEEVDELQIKYMKLQMFFIIY